VEFAKRQHQKENSDLLIGQDAKALIANKDDLLRSKKVEEFYADVQKYFQTVCRYFLCFVFIF
jgi:hypothetical protein